MTSAIKASHLFNLLDARGVISVTERAAYIGRVRAPRQGLLRSLARRSAVNGGKPSEVPPSGPTS